MSTCGKEKSYGHQLCLLHLYYPLVLQTGQK
jgi:hypothetical protein